MKMKSFEEFEEYAMNYKDFSRVIEKVKVMVERCTDDKIKRDALLINEGAGVLLYPICDTTRRSRRRRKK